MKVQKTSAPNRAVPRIFRAPWGRGRGDTGGAAAGGVLVDLALWHERRGGFDACFGAADKLPPNEKAHVIRGVVGLLPLEVAQVLVGICRDYTSGKGKDVIKISFYVGWHEFQRALWGSQEDF